jgi:hypothetical protein
MPLSFLLLDEGVRGRRFLGLTVVVKIPVLGPYQHKSEKWVAFLYQEAAELAEAMGLLKGARLADHVLDRRSTLQDSATLLAHPHRETAEGSPKRKRGNG